MRRARRALLSLLALTSFLGVGFGDARGIHACPHHDGLPAPPASASPGASSTHHGMAGHAAAAPGHADAGDHGAEHGPCTCVGQCAAGGSPAVPAARPGTAAAPLPGIRITASAVAPRAPRADESWSPYLPNAPPLPV